MKKKSKFQNSIQVDPVSGDLYVSIPESIINELDWYEDTVVELELIGDEVIIKESQK